MHTHFARTKHIYLYVLSGLLRGPIELVIISFYSRWLIVCIRQMVKKMNIDIKIKFDKRERWNDL